MEDARRQRWECRCGGQPCGFRDLGWKPKRGSWESPRHVSWNYSAHQSSHAGCCAVSGICLLAGFVFGWPVSCLCRGSTGRARTGPERSALLRRCTSLLRLTELLKVEFWVSEKFFSLLRAASFCRVDSFSREDNSSALCHSRYPPGEGSHLSSSSIHANHLGSGGARSCAAADMFCFCFQSPSLKLQALEADSGPHEASADSQPQENPPAQHQPLAAEDKSLQPGHRLLLHPPPTPHAPDPRMNEPSQPGRTAGGFFSTTTSSVSALVNLVTWI